MDIDLASVTTTEQVTQIATYIAMGIFFVIFLLILQVIIIRFRFILNNKRHKRLLEKWRPILTHVLLGQKPEISVLPRNEVNIFLNEWNRIFGTIRGDNLESLVKLAQRLRVDIYARQMLKKRNIRTRLLAIITLGHMREYSAWDELSELLQHPHPILSITAARALMWIDAKHAIDKILPLIISREDWPWSNVAHVLKQANPELICNKLSATVTEASPEHQPGLLRYLETARCLQLTKTVTHILQTTKEDRVSSVCLHIISDPDALPTIRKYTSHPRWHVRMHAASALGRLSKEEDLELLLKMTEDESWWVRYRAAQAIVKIPGQDAEKLNALRDKQKDKYARDILTQAIAEVQ